MYLRQVLTIAAKDLRAEWRTREAFNASFAFMVVILVLFSFAFDPGNSDISIPAIAGGMLWIAYSFAAALTLNRSFARELQNDCLDALLAAPILASALFFGKALANFALLMVMEIVSLGVFSLLYNVKVLAQIWSLLLVIVLGTWAMTVMGTMFSALTVNLRLRELMLPVMMYPFLVVPLSAAITLTSDLLNGISFGAENILWLKVLVFFDVLFTSLVVLLIDVVLVG
ncbi:MAG TPA: heme exporter protein CcmB [Bryobacteraceae bacterium]